MKLENKLFDLGTAIAFTLTGYVISLGPDAEADVLYILFGIIIFCIVTDKPIKWYLNRRKKNK